MNPFESLMDNIENIEQEQDRLPGRKTLPSAIYPAKIRLAYATLSKRGARGLALHLELPDGEIYKETLWMTTNKKNGQLNYYIRKSDNKKSYLEGFNRANAVSRLTTGAAIHELSAKKEVHTLWDPEKGEERPMEVDAFPQLAGEGLYVGILEIRENRKVQDPVSGDWRPSAEIRVVNQIDKIFRKSDRRTTQEIRSMAQSTHYAKWENTLQGNIQDRTQKVEPEEEAIQGIPGMASKDPFLELSGNSGIPEGEALK